jgi:hypothetical protein
MVSAGCRNSDVVTASYASVAEAREAGAIAHGWIPEGIPPGAHDLREAHDLDTNRHWGLFNFLQSDTDAVRALVQQDEISLTGTTCDIPARIEWWPPLLRGTLDAEQIKAAGLKTYRARDRNRIVAVNWNQGRAYYWTQQ